MEADIESHHVRNNTYAPAGFRLVLEVTAESSTYDLHIKSAAYAEAGIPVYVVIDREHECIRVLTDPAEDEYTTHRVHAPGETVNLPTCFGAGVALDVADYF
ncbi:Uma2 family endonuclease [Streptomyces sp. CRN 30]|uniref:Uma2 family endonuclease n=1 Tax=Streptomyces sp. CRN 30 TaxID=3075613 RepID=UPI002A80464C|nr:Uma2 family endonuclease [Streptomyces sp. CRN 30]